MDDADLRLDGNAAAGVLDEIFSFEITTVEARCTACGAARPVGALAAYVSPMGVVLRCPRCDNVLIRAVHNGERYWLDCQGINWLQVGTAP